jgi:class 3 adenylate cyclase
MSIEEAVINTAKQCLQSESDQDNVLSKPYADLLTAYQRSIKNMAKVTKLSDRHHLKLNESVADAKDKQQQLEAMSEKLRRYLSPQIYQSIFEGHNDGELSHCRKKLSVFFSDIEGFTDLTDKTDPETLAYVLNSYLTTMSGIVARYGGTIDKFIGDAIMVFFGDPTSKGDDYDALACITMAIEMREEMKSLRQRWDDEGIHLPLRIRMGINTGFCTVGNFGSEDHMDYTIIGGHVNLASRLESIADPGQILISEDTFTLVKHKIVCSPKELVNVRGMAYPVQTYQVLDRIERVEQIKHEMNINSQAFSLSVDYNKLEQNDRERDHLLEILRDVISALG